MEPRVSVLLINLNNLDYTKNCFEYLVRQDILFNLKIVDQNSSEKGTQEYYNYIFDRHLSGYYKDKIHIMGVYNSGYNKPISQVWNEFIRESDTEFVCLLNNDVIIAPNFLSSAIYAMDSDPKIGVVNHPTNKKEYNKWSTDNNIVKISEPYRQGWDPIFRKECYFNIPDKIDFFYGDDFLYSKLYSNGYYGSYVLNSPMIHHECSTTIDKGGVRDMSNDFINFQNQNLQYINLSFNENFSTWKPEITSIEFIENKYIKETYITRDANIEEWETHLNATLLNQYQDYLFGVCADFGCNHGACTIISSKNKLISKLVGIDINEESLFVASKLLNEYMDSNRGDLNITYLHSDLRNLSTISDDYFDSAYSFHTLEHIFIDDYDSVFSEWKRVLKHNAPFLISIPYEQACYDLTHTNFFNETNLTELFKKYNFTILECYRDRRLNNDCLNLLCRNNKDIDKIKLSILICSLTERSSKFLSPLLESLEKQIENQPVEIIVFSDNAKRPIGKKRNDCLLLSQGEYVCFVDDDDRISDDYVLSILNSISKNPDVIVFDAEISFNGENKKKVKYGKEFNYCELNSVYYRHPNHLMVHKKNNITESYKEIKTGEDDEWAFRMLNNIKIQERIDRVLYYYDYNTETKKYFD